MLRYTDIPRALTLEMSCVMTSSQHNDLNSIANCPCRFLHFNVLSMRTTHAHALFIYARSHMLYFWCVLCTEMVFVNFRKSGSCCLGALWVRCGCAVGSVRVSSATGVCVYVSVCEIARTRVLCQRRSHLSSYSRNCCLIPSTVIRSGL